MNNCKGILPRALVFFLIFTVVCGLLYTAFLTGVAQLVFPHQANGSLITVDGKTYGSSLMGQQFTAENHMWGRIMQLDVSTYKDANGKALLYAAPSNKSPASEEYAQMVAERVAKLRAASPEMGETPIPVDLVTSSGSGLDPHISKAAAQYQVARLARENALSETQVMELIADCTEGRFLWVFGEETVNVLKVNLMLEGILPRDK